MRPIDADSLKRKVQKEATESWKMKIKASVETVLNQVIDWIDEAQTVEPAQQWIPVTEQLPRYGEDVLVSIGGYCNVGHIVPTNDEKQYNWYYSGWYHDPCDVVAWCPLPEPWEGGAEECH